MVKLAIRAHPYCVDCGATRDLTGDHITPVSAGGLNTRTNIAVRCRACNSRKGGRRSTSTKPQPQPASDPPSIG
jgi:5-methylcytosine-specific restriction endonuclease McrA